MIRVLLVRTAPPAPPGSMAAFAETVGRALALRTGEVAAGVLDFFDPAAGGNFWRQHAWRFRRARGRFSGPGPDLYHLLDGSMAAFIPRAVRARTLVSLHDLFPLRQLRGELPGRQSAPAAWLVRRGARALGGCRALCADSAATRADLERILGLRGARVIPPAVKTLAAPGPPADPPAPGRFLLHVGHNAGYKNRAGALRVFSRLRDRPGLQLVLAGPPPTAALLGEAAGRDGVRFLVHPGEAELSWLYRNAALLLFPSRDEGFGLPVIEAMSAGCPVVCSDAGALPEAAGGAALMAPFDDDEALADHCRTLLKDPARRAERIAAGRRQAEAFSLERMAGALCDWYRQSLGGERR